LIASTPYSSLSPDLILNAIESLGQHCSGSLLALNSYENRVYQVGMDDGAPLIAKFYRPERWSDAAILEEHQFSAELLSYEIPVIAPLVIADATLHHYEGFRFALFPRMGGRALELDNPDHLEWMGRFIGRFHAVSATRKFQHRMTLNVESYAVVPYQFLLNNDFIPESIRHNYCLVMDNLITIMQEILATVGHIDHIRLHGDCHAGNILWHDARPHIVDLDDCLMGPAIQDIWMLLSGNASQMNMQLDKILDGYCEFHDYNPAELHLIETLRTLRMIHYSGWLAKRWEDPAFPLNFPWFHTPRYWENHLQHLKEQEELLITRT